MYIAIVVLFLLASLLIQLLVFGPRQFRKRTKLISDYIAKRGYRLLNPSIMQISSTSSARDLLTNPSLKSYGIGSKEVMIFELSVSSQRTDDKGRALRYKVAKIANEGLPRFSLGRHSVV